ncbi:MAG: hypothetical protein NTX38_17960 [Methylobacter sp.]|nr:hypothetical protein [Methylobacter sp.]
MFEIDWQNACLRLNDEARNAFTSNPAPELIWIPNDFIMYRLRTKITSISQYKSPDSSPRPVGSNILKSPWWFTEDTFEKLINGQGSITSTAREMLAVPTRFNADFDNLISIKTKVSGYCYLGLTSPMSLVENGKEYLKGGFEQIWIPNLQPSQVNILAYGDVGTF